MAHNYILKASEFEHTHTHTQTEWYFIRKYGDKQIFGNEITNVKTNPNRLEWMRANVCSCDAECHALGLPIFGSFAKIMNIYIKHYANDPELCSCKTILHFVVFAIRHMKIEPNKTAKQ